MIVFSSLQNYWFLGLTDVCIGNMDFPCVWDKGLSAVGRFCVLIELILHEIHQLSSIRRRSQDILKSLQNPLPFFPWEGVLQTGMRGTKCPSECWSSLYKGLQLPQVHCTLMEGSFLLMGSNSGAVGPRWAHAAFSLNTMESNLFMENTLKSSEELAFFYVWS